MNGRPRCSEHPDSAAGWRCEDCGRTLCPACTAAQPVGVSAFEVCVPCDGRAAVLTVPGSQESFGQLFLLSLRVDVGWITLALLVGVWALVHLAWKLPAAGSGGVFALLLTGLWFLFFAVLQAAWKGADRVGYSGASIRFKEDLLWPALRMMALTWWVVAAVWWLTRELRFERRADEDPRAWALVLSLALVIPAWVLALGRGMGCCAPSPPPPSGG